MGSLDGRVIAAVPGTWPQGFSPVLEPGGGVIPAGGVAPAGGVIPAGGVADPQGGASKDDFMYSSRRVEYLGSFAQF